VVQVKNQLKLVGSRKGLAPNVVGSAWVGVDDKALTDSNLGAAGGPGTEGVLIGRSERLGGSIPSQEGVTFGRGVAEVGVQSASDGENGGHEVELTTTGDGDAALGHHFADEVDGSSRGNVHEDRLAGGQLNFGTIPRAEAQGLGVITCTVPVEQNGTVRSGGEQGLSSVVGGVQRVSNKVVASHEVELRIANDVGANRTESDRGGRAGRDRRQEKGFGLHVYYL